MSEIIKIQSKEQTPTPDGDLSEVQLDEFGQTQAMGGIALESAKIEPLDPEAGGPDIGRALPEIQEAFKMPTAKILGGTAIRHPLSDYRTGPNLGAPLPKLHEAYSIPANDAENGRIARR